MLGVKASVRYVLSITDNTVECCYSTVQRHDFSYGTTMTETEHASEVIFTKDIPYLTLTGEVWGVFCEDLSEN